jgi:hypothetical protein
MNGGGKTEGESVFMQIKTGSGTHSRNTESPDKIQQTTDNTKETASSREQA